MKRLITILILLFTFNTAQAYQVDCEKRFQPILEKIEQLPEGNQLIEKAVKDGNIRIRTNRNLGNFEGYWNGGSRTIYLTCNHHTDEAQLITTLIFELHNATRANEFFELDHLAWHGKIKRKDYIRDNEYIEYENVIATAKILDSGRQAGIFPHNCYWNFHKNFEDHFRLQRSMGHSGYIGHSYDNLTH